MTASRDEVCPDCNGLQYNLYEEDRRFLKGKCSTCDGCGHVLVDEYGHILKHQPLPVAALPEPIDIPQVEEDISF